MSRNNFIFTGLLLMTFFLMPWQIFAQQTPQTQQQWRLIESRFCTILCHPDVDVKKVAQKIKIKFYDLDCGPFFLRSESDEEKLSKKIDCIFRKVEEILDMHPRKIHLTIKIFPDQAHLDDAYLQIFDHANEAKRISYYIHKYATIYTTEEVVSQGLLAHEMSHAVCDHYFLILPPEKVKELLAQYAEMQLEN